MTAVCGGGTSGPKLGVAAVVDYSSGLIASILAARGLGWLIPVIPLAGLPPLILSAFCSGDPPAIPTFTSAETNALINLQFGADFDSGLSKLADLISHSIWYDVCQCTSGSLTAFPTITPPAGTPIFQPPTSPAVAPCVVVPFTDTGCDRGNLFKGSGLPMTGRTVTSVALHMVATDCAGAGAAGVFNWVWTFKDAADTTLSTVIYSLTGTAVLDTFVACPTGTAYVNLNHNQTGGARGQQIAGTSQSFYCNGAVPGAQQPCCPPDTSTQSYLDLILKMVTLIQRQSVPFAYTPSVTHPGLSGTGVLDISGLLGVLVDVTTLPTPLGRAGTSPTEYFDMGFITFGTLDGYPQSIRLERQHQVMLPARCGLFTQLAHDLHPGVIVTITELVREP